MKAAADTGETPGDQPKDTKVVSQMYGQKRRVVVKRRVKKVRPEGYDPEAKRKMRNVASLGDKSFATDELNNEEEKVAFAKIKERERKKVIYENMFKNFSTNYTKTLEDMVENSKHYFHKRAQERQVIHKNAPVPVD